MIALVFSAARRVGWSAMLGDFCAAPLKKQEVGWVRCLAINRQPLTGFEKEPISGSIFL
jgi:hypothetical protein